jgi:thiol-disulfide isomerase/thioredoxin
MTKAPALSGDTWLGTTTDSLGIESFRGRFLLLDFWTLCCVNCHHVLAELRELETTYADVLTVVGVHSPKFEHEKLADTVTQAIIRHDIAHPVLNDPDMTTWAAYGVRAWPTLVLVDPEGNIVATYSGEGHGHAIDALLQSLIPQFETRGTLERGAGVYLPLEAPSGVFRQPGKVTAIPLDYREFFAGADILVSHSAGHRLDAIHHASPETIVWSAGSGDRGYRDGTLLNSQFCEPYGVAWVGPENVETLGYHLVVADTANHLLRGINLRSGAVSTLAGTGRQWMALEPTSGNAQEVSLTTPWDVLIDGTTALIAMAGDHRIWRCDLAAGQVGVFAGTSNEGLVDGDVTEAWFAQSSGLAGTGSDVWVVDAETSAIRRISNGQVTTVVGQGLYDFGHVDGAGDQALLQHPLGIAMLPDGSVAIADSYNGAIRRYNPHTNQVTTLHRGLREPSDIAVLDDGDEVKLAVAESSANRIVVLGLPADTVHRGEELRLVRAPIEVAPGDVTVRVIFEPPPGQKRDDRYGPSTQLVVSSTPRELLSGGGGNTTELERVVQLSAQHSSGILHVQAKGASCEDGEFASCHIHQQDWGIPIVVVPGGLTKVTLTLSGSVSGA